MQTKKVEVINPYNQKQVEQMNDFCLHQGIDNVAKEFLAIQKNQEEIKYYKNLMISPVENRYLAFYDKEQMKDYCRLRIEKDMSRCFLTFPELLEEKGTREILPYAVSYATMDLEMKEVFLKMKHCNKKTMSLLEKYGFESLGTDQEESIYLFSKEEEKVKEHSFL